MLSVTKVLWLCFVKSPYLLEILINVFTDEVIHLELILKTRHLGRKKWKINKTQIKKIDHIAIVFLFSH